MDEPLARGEAIDEVENLVGGRLLRLRVDPRHELIDEPFLGSLEEIAVDREAHLVLAQKRKKAGEVAHEIDPITTSVTTVEGCSSERARSFPSTASWNNTNDSSLAWMP